LKLLYDRLRAKAEDRVRKPAW
jgi:hypothetical protein